jgi:hypothetical protein
MIIILSEFNIAMETHLFLLGKWSVKRQFSRVILSYRKVMPRITWSLSARSCAESTPANPTMPGTYWKPICRSEGWRRGWGEAHDPGNPRCRTSPQLHRHFVGPNISKTMNRNYSHSKRIAYHILSHITYYHISLFHTISHMLSY